MICMYILCIVWIERENIRHIVLSYICNRTYESVPTNQTLLYNVNKIINNNINDRYTYSLIDFGSGVGDFLIHMKDQHHTLIGVELDKSSHDEAVNNCSAHRNIFLENDDMVKYNFRDEKSILYIYEPLFNLESCIHMNEIYNTVIENYTRDVKYSKKYIVYVESVTLFNVKNSSCVKHIFTSFTQNNFTLKEHIVSGLWPIVRNVYIYEFT